MHFSSIGNPYIKTIAVPHINFTKLKGTCNLNSTQCYFNGTVFKIVNNKKVLLHERKRHTACCIASTHCAGLGGYPIPGRGGTQSQVQGGTRSQVCGGTQSQVQGVPSPRSGGLPHPRSRGYPPTQTWDGVPPSLDLGWSTPYLDLGWGTPYLDLGWGTPLPRPEMGYPLPYQDLRWGTPPPHKCGQTENITSRHPSDAGSKNL